MSTDEVKGSIVYIDTEMKFSAARLTEIACAMQPEVGAIKLLVYLETVTAACAKRVRAAASVEPRRALS